MKKILLLFVILTLNKIGFCQYVHFPDSNALWILDFVGPEVYAVNGDTTINNVGYKKYFVCNFCVNILPTTLYGFLREDTLTKKVFGFTTDTTSEQLLYDFSLNVGDTTSVFSFMWGTYGYAFVKVSAIDSILILGQYRKRLAIVDLGGNSNSYPEFWIEGIGSTFGLFKSGITGHPPNSWGGLGVPQLVCFQQNDSLLYHNQNFSGCYPNQWLGNRSSLKDKTIQIFPNPVNDKIYFANLTTNSIVSIYNSLGQMQETNSKLNNNGIDISNLAKGFYTYSITDHQQNIMAIGKFIKE
jgi:hypothetical protein